MNIEKPQKKRLAFPLAVPIAFLLFMFLCLVGCPQETEDYSIGEITIYNIPAKIRVTGEDNVLLDTYKIYLNASDYMESDKLPKAKGLAKISDGTLESNGKYTITLQLQNPNPQNNTNPNQLTGSWNGTANYFSVMISPKNIAGYEERAIRVMGSLESLDKGKKRLNWENLLDFSYIIENDTTTANSLKLPDKLTALYEQCILNDSDLERLQ